MRLFSVLRTLPDWTTTEAEWRRQLGDEFRHARCMLSRMEEGATWLRLGPGRTHEIFRHGPDDVVAVCPESGASTPLLPDQDTRFELNGDRLAQLIAGALGSDEPPMRVAGERFSWWLGEVELLAKRRHRVALVANPACLPVSASVNHILAIAQSRLAVIPANPGMLDAVLEERIGAGGGMSLRAAAVILDWSPDGALRLTEQLVTPSEVHSESSVEPIEDDETIDLEGGLRLLRGQRIVQFDGASIAFTARSSLRFEVLWFMARRRNRWIDLKALTERTGPWNGKKISDDALHSMARSIRSLLRPDAAPVADALHAERQGNATGLRFNWPPKSQ